MKPVVLVAGALANKPSNGGNAWTRLCWVLGLRRLGFDAWFVEQISARDCTDACGAPAPFAASANSDYFRSVMARFGLGDRSALLCHETGESVGTGLRELAAIAGRAELLVNISGHLGHEALFSGPRVRLYYDDDPGHTQFWHASGNGAARCGGHDLYYTVGGNIGSPGCIVPSDGIVWRPLLPPVYLPEWPAVPKAAFDRFTTVASWRGAYGTVTHAGRVFGQKAHEFRRFADLPSRVDRRFEIALRIDDGDSADRERLQTSGWDLAEPDRHAGTPDAYRTYIRDSGAEFSVAQGIYVDTQAGWFSDRTARYLASGRPALVQDTGFGRTLPTGLGLLAFRSVDEAVEGARRIASDYAAHAAAARAIAVEFFDTDRVLGSLLRELGLHEPRRVIRPAVAPREATVTA